MRFIIILLSLFLMNCASSEKTANQESMTGKIVKAKVVKEPTKNKAGRVLDGVFSYYLKYDGNSRFIKFSESEVSPSELDSIGDQNIEFRILEKNGLWDTDDPNVQSRIGDYVCILEIIGR